MKAAGGGAGGAIGEWVRAVSQLDGFDQRAAIPTAWE